MSTTKTELVQNFKSTKGVLKTYLDFSVFPKTNTTNTEIVLDNFRWKEEKSFLGSQNNFFPLSTDDDDGNNDKDVDEVSLLASPETASSIPKILSPKMSPSMAVPVTTDSSTPFHTPLKYWNIYVDDFCGVMQGNK